jgi:hypothetical protein
VLLRAEIEQAHLPHLDAALEEGDQQFNRSQRQAGVDGEHFGRATALCLEAKQAVPTADIDHALCPEVQLAHQAEDRRMGLVNVIPARRRSLRRDRNPVIPTVVAKARLNLCVRERVGRRIGWRNE